MSPPTHKAACVRCGKPRNPAFTPFCSSGCKDRDLLDWFGERQVLPGDDGEALDIIGRGILHDPRAEALDNGALDIPGERD